MSLLSMNSTKRYLRVLFSFLRNSLRPMFRIVALNRSMRVVRPINASSSLQILAGNIYSVTETGVTVDDNFSRLLIVECLARMLHNASDNRPFNSSGTLPVIFDDDIATRGTWNFFRGLPVGTTRGYPDDVDTTCYALRVLPIDPIIANGVLDRILAFTESHPDKIIPVYFPEHCGDDNSSRCTILDPIVCVNALRCFAHYGRFDEPCLAPTKAYVGHVLREPALMLDGTRYYPSPDALPFFASLLVTELEARGPVHETFVQATTPLLQNYLVVSAEALVGASVDPLSVAMHLLAAYSLGLEIDCRTVQALEAAQLDTSAGWLCRYGRTGVRIANRSLTRLLVEEALGRRECSVLEAFLW
ncbi:putative had-like protein [Mycena indigotica]|uniref:Putative had-like protein n=1 Tax=Mycena indigotica TaxID=2126181 RepID=A0A8H6S0H8_9AGAR|nr:putative had-like protein [Mycena indigotica]KAF7290212.1 putative had-like protein [Mycena indigotica]